MLWFIALRQAKGTAEEIFTVYGNGIAIIESRIGFKNLELQISSWKMKTAATTDDIIKTELTENPCYTISEILDSTNIPKATVHSIIMGNAN